MQNATEGNDPIFQPDDVPVKTPKGARESRIQTAESSLPRRLRTLLMVVDGKTPFRIYAETLANYGDVGTLFEALETGGYLTRQHGAAVDPAPEAPEPPEAVRAEPAAAESRGPRAVARPGMDRLEFQQLITEISTLVEGKLGADAMEVLLKLEAAGEPQDLLDMLPELGRDLEKHLGSRNARKFVSEIRKQLA